MSAPRLAAFVIRQQEETDVNEILLRTTSREL
jgi:hypothetical protein